MKIIVAVLVVALMAITISCSQADDRESAMQYANRNGYFWLPCPVCGEYYGGQEKSSGGIITEIHEGWTLDHGVCPNPKCAAKADKINLNTLRAWAKEHGKKIPAKTTAMEALFLVMQWSMEKEKP